MLPNLAEVTQAAFFALEPLTQFAPVTESPPLLLPRVQIVAPASGDAIKCDNAAPRFTDTAAQDGSTLRSPGSQDLAGFGIFDAGRDG
jgi:hypothetical protein